MNRLLNGILLVAGILLTPTLSFAQTGNNSWDKAQAKRVRSKLKDGIKWYHEVFGNDTLYFMRVDYKVLNNIAKNPNFYGFTEAVGKLEMSLDSLLNKIERQEHTLGSLDETKEKLQTLERLTDTSFSVKPYQDELAFYTRCKEVIDLRNKHIQDSLAERAKRSAGIIDGSDSATVLTMSNSVPEYNGQYSMRYKSLHKHLVLFSNTHPFWLNEIYLFLQDRGWVPTGATMTGKLSKVVLKGPCSGCDEADRPTLKVTATIDPVKNVTKNVVITGTQRAVVNFFVAYWSYSDINVSTKKKAFYYNLGSDRIILEGGPGEAVVRIIPNPNVGPYYLK
ncbi:hypothetical protein [Chitinophaga sp. 212800010-3]|uniref:hypothetical protein n=1 Tax=unclassified Chitinophaga TaxID=2619133 RepID=UPI002DE30E8A|nr:hypothetical protein [Chitinophaga sp. 212800010-3]